MKKFYILRYEYYGKKMPFGMDILNPGCDIIRCEELDVSGMKASFMDMNVKIFADSELQDIEGVGTRILVSKKFRDIVQKEELKGLLYNEIVEYKYAKLNKEVETVLKKVNEIFVYKPIWPELEWKLSPKSGCKLERECQKCKWEEWTSPINGIWIEQEDLPDVDFLRIREMPGLILISEKAKSALEKGEISNMRTILSTDFKPT